MAKKITQNVNKDAGLMDMPKVRVESSRWQTKSSNYITCNIGDIVPIFVDEVLPDEKRRMTMGMLSHMTTPIAPIFNAQYTEFRSFFVPYRLCADLLGGYSTRKSPWVKVFGEDNKSASSDIVVPLSSQKLPDVSTNLRSDFFGNFKAFGGIADALDYENVASLSSSSLWSNLNFLEFAGYELIYQHKYRNENRESATESDLYKWCFNLYNRTSTSGAGYNDAFHVANREKDYFTGSQPFTQKSSAPVTVGLQGNAPVYAKVGPGVTIPAGEQWMLGINEDHAGGTYGTFVNLDTAAVIGNSADFANGDAVASSLVADLTKASGVDINQLRLMIKTQELLEKDMMYGSKYIESLNAHFGCAPMSLVLEEPLELKKVTITSHMQPIFQSSSTSGEATILGTIGANATTQSGEFEIVPETKFLEHGLLIICAVHKSQNSYDALYYKPKRIYKKSRFDFYTPELNDLGYQPVSRLEFAPSRANSSTTESVSYNEAWADYRFKFNKVHGMFEPSRSGALSYWTLATSNVADIQSLYKQPVDELNRAISVASTTSPQFYDAYGFVETNEKPMSLHSIPGMDGVI